MRQFVVKLEVTSVIPETVFVNAETFEEAKSRAEQKFSNRTFRDIRVKKISELNYKEV